MAADFAANDQLHSLLGGGELPTVFHQGVDESIYLVGAGDRVLLVVLFGRAVPLGMVRVRARQAVGELMPILAAAAAHPAPASRPFEQSWAEEAESQLDRLFGGL